MKKEKILKSNVYQVIIPLDTTLEKIINTDKFSIKEFDNEVYLIEEITEETSEDKEAMFEAEQAEKAKTDAYYEANRSLIN